MNPNQKFKWWLDVVLFAAFLVAFFLDLTGLDLHQWIGLGGGLLALYHLATRWNWIKAVSARFWGKTSPQARLYYLVDAGLLAGFLAIVATGLIISSWFNLSLANYAAWRAVHIGTSFFTLLVVILKLGLHWRWIAATARKIFASPVPAFLPRSPAPAQALTRREFLKVMGVVGASSVFALGSSFRSLQDSAQAAQPGSAISNGGSAAATGPSTAAAAITDTSAAQAAVSGTTSSAQSASISSTITSACVVRCNRGCSFPGRCGRYSDSNGNQRCDLGECL